MDTRDEMRQIARKIESSEKKHRALLQQRDELARRAISEKIPWRETQRILGLSSRGLKIILARND